MTIPVTIIAGYLGSGKTTLINRILGSTESMQGIAVLVNDFGQINIDAALMRSVSPQGNIYGLENGCVCCSIEDGLAVTLEQIKQTATRHVLLEASGVGHPTRLRSQCNYPGYTASTCWVMVDALNFDTKSRDQYVGNLVKEQVAAADALIISKLDLAPDFQINIAKPRYTVQDPHLARALWIDPATHHPAQPSTTHADFATRTLTPESGSADALRRFVTSLPDYVERVKGVVTTTEGNLLIQRAGKVLDLQFTRERQSGLVLIFPAAFTAQLEQFLHHHAPRSVPGFPPDVAR